MNGEYLQQFKDVFLELDRWAIPHRGLLIFVSMGLNLAAILAIFWLSRLMSKHTRKVNRESFGTSYDYQEKRGIQLWEIFWAVFGVGRKYGGGLVFNTLIYYLRFFILASTILSYLVRRH